MRILIIDGHPDQGRLTSHLLDIYQNALPDGAAIERVAVRDLTFAPVLRHGYAQRMEWEADVRKIAAQIDACDHLVIAFPMWWGAEPAELKGLLDRLLLPGFAFAYHEDGPWWDKFFAGRSADVIVTTDTPPLFLRLIYGNSIVHRWKKQILGFTGFKPVRVLPLGPVRNNDTEKSMAKWSSKIGKLARSIKQAKPEEKAARLEKFLNP